MAIERNNNLDTLKALSISFVFIWHLRPFQFIINDFTPVNVFILAKNLRNLELQLSLTAVPIFYIVSLYLFFQNSSDFRYFQKRIIKLIKIYLFWLIVQNIFFMSAVRTIPNFSWENIKGVEPSLPLVGDSVFYFIFNLICLTILAYLYQLIESDYLKIIISTTVVIFCLFYFEACCLLNLSIPYHWVINFVIYIPIAFYLVKCPEKLLNFKFYYLIAFILFSFHDIYLRTSGYYSSIYGRISIISGAMTIFCYIYSRKEIKESFLVQKLSKYSLGLFSLHKYWQYLFFLLVQHYQVGINIGIFGTYLSEIFIIEGFFVVFFTILSIYLLKLTFLKQFIA
ncbi:MAG: acyltransferase family protein [Nostoc sp. DedVER02]|uniref:acyltransferase family protein n=1 Tax=unclassified Nostoc TaxID=2593658 RepID=UPI002AD3417E|nr:MULTISPECIES: acyltransferase family protein [unclassified Nostoc]MDZ7988760.1 acyltransferase family protein [Nostoc sp. DedVER02]MDZ8113171.1 acyltransferase family protein [Nostoc sp. DedVER01b]